MPPKKEEEQLINPVKWINQALGQINLGSEKVNKFVVPGFWLMIGLMVGSWAVHGGFTAGTELVGTVYGQATDIGGAVGTTIMDVTMSIWHAIFGNAEASSTMVPLTEFVVEELPVFTAVPLPEVSEVIQEVRPTVLQDVPDLSDALMK